MQERWDAVIIGGGLAGLATAVYLARAGLSVAVAEKSSRLGGRAMTVKKNGALFNLGGHALYQGGEAAGVLKELGVEFAGGMPALDGAAAIWKDEAVPLPGGLMSLLNFRLLSLQGKMAFSRLMMKLSRTDPDRLGRISLREWTEKECADPMVRHLFYAFSRVATYSRDPGRLLAGVVIRQLQRSQSRGVLYLDGGWQTLVDGLRHKAVEAGAVLLEGRAVTRIEQNGQVHVVLLEGGERLEARNAVITAGPAAACRLVQEAERTSLAKWKEEARPVLAACLDLALKRLPVPDRHLAIGVDRPVFFTHHSRVARLSEDGSLVVHVIKYLGEEPGDAQAHERELEQVMDRLHPGWRSEVVARQFLPHIVVSHDSPTADKSAFPGPAVPEVRGLYVAGDGYGHGELLADAALASSKRAAEAILHKRPAQGEGGRMDGEGGTVRVL